MYFPKKFVYILHLHSQGGYVVFILSLTFNQFACVVLECIFLYMAYDLLQIAPADLEAVLILHPEIVDVAVTA